MFPSQALVVRPLFHPISMNTKVAGPVSYSGSQTKQQPLQSNTLRPNSNGSNLKTWLEKRTPSLQRGER